MDSQFIEFVCFNVAGQRFTTTRETILKEPASRLALMARGVLPVSKDDSGAIFLDRDAKYFQLVLNYLRDGWCNMPKSQDERRELLQEIRYYQLAGMEAWIRSQDTTADTTLRSPSPDPYTSGLRESLPPATGSPYYASSTEASPAAGYYANPTASPHSSPIRSSFVYGPNQDLLTASLNVRHSISPAAASSPAAAAASLRLMAQQAGTPDAPYNQAGFSNTGYGSPGVQQSPSPVMARPSSAAAAYSGGVAGPQEAAANYAAGFQAGAAAERRSLSFIDGFGAANRPSGLSASIDAAGGGSPVGQGRRSPSPLPNDGYKWTSRYLQSNAKMQQTVETLLELAYVAPHSSLQAGKSIISISSECDHDRISSMLGAAGLGAARFRYQVIRVQNSTGWAFTFSLTPSSDLALYDKYNIAEYVQDNFFVLTAVLKDQYGVLMEEDNTARPKCVACRRNNITVTLHKVL